MIQTVYYNQQPYPKFQTEGNAAKFAIPFAQQVCKGTGYDIGCNKIEWSFPGSTPVDPVIDSRYHALCLPNPDTQVDYIFSSHCLEHINAKWYDVLEYWVKALVNNGVLFLYLPDFSQEYWRPWNNKKHLHVFTPEILHDAFKSLYLKNIFVSGIDLNNSFMIMGQK